MSPLELGQFLSTPPYDHMSDPTLPLPPLVHPHQLEVQDFAAYALIIDARSRSEYAVDHIPGAINLPASLHEPGPSTTTLSVAEPRPMSYALAPHLEPLGLDDSVLVYCSKGGLDSEVWASELRGRGYEVDVLGGGWGNYRRWVDAGLMLLPRTLLLRWVQAPPVGGLALVLEALELHSEQVLDLTTLTGQCLAPGITLPGEPQVSQDLFETTLLDALRYFDPDRPIWVGGSPPFGKLELPPALLAALQASRVVRVEAPVNARSIAWLEQLQRQQVSVASLIDTLQMLPQQLSSLSSLATLKAAISSRQPAEVLTTILSHCIDTMFSGPASQDAVSLRLPTLDHGEVVDAVGRWLAAGG